MQYEAGILPLSTVICIGVNLFLCIGVPVGVLIYVKMQTKATFRPFLIGVLVFLTLVLGLEQGLHMLVLEVNSPVKEFLTGHWWAYGLYGALAAGLFEETGRVIGYKILLRKEDHPGVCLMYGVGHGGAEAVLIGGMTAISNLVVGIGLRTMGMDEFLGQYDSYTASTMEQSLRDFYNLSGIDFLVPGLERLMAFALQIALSVLIFMAVRNFRKRYYYLIAVLLHGLADFPVALYQFGTITNVWLIEGVLLVVTLFTCWLAVNEYRTLRREVY